MTASVNVITAISIIALLRPTSSLFNSTHFPHYLILKITATATATAIMSVKEVTFTPFTDQKPGT
jgi:hypothetical protein